MSYNNHHFLIPETETAIILDYQY